MLPALMLTANMATQSQPQVLHKGLVITNSCTVAGREYLMPTPQGIKNAGEEQIPTLTPAITIRGNNVTVDFNAAILRGTSAMIEPDLRKGLGVLVEGMNITIKNLNVRGYKVGLMAQNCTGLRILHSDFSYNWKQRLLSTPEREDERDWQSYHHNEHDEWLRYGAAIYLKGCSKFEIRESRATSGQCGLMLVQSNEGLAINNDFSFLSGIGIGLYRSSSNRVVYNKLDWCVRGFSYGVYNRGQDSAGILVFEQSRENLFAFNSATHGGDGFFLWAGQSTMDTGKGGCNGNVLYGNEFSHSPCNGIEATFSANSFVNNKLVECWHGVWGGYSFNTFIAANVFGFNGEGIAIEHGRDNSITNNLFYRENTAVDLWQDPIQDKKWAYPKHHDTASRDYQIALNLFDRSSAAAIAVRDTLRVMVGGNEFRHCFSSVKEAGSNTGSRLFVTQVEPGDVPKPTMTTAGQPTPGTSDDVSAYLRRFDIPWAPFAQVAALKKLKRTLTPEEQRVVDGGFSVPTIQGGKSPYLKPGALRGQRYILVGPWGPYDFRSPLLCPREVLAGAPAGVTKQRFEILGPPGKWRIVSKSAGMHPSTESGAVPGFVDVDFPAATKPQVELEYVGARTVDYRGVAAPAGKMVKFGLL